jgi:BirA family biotin operon repressor/biotin-[acetyl-CoA-carboxylase] ligase
MQEPHLLTAPLSQAWLTAELAGIGRRIEVQVHDCIGSTNDWCLQQLRQGRRPPFVCLAEQQTRGHGRRGRRWVSQPGSGLLLSIAIRVPLAVEDIGLLSPAVGLSIFRLLQAAGVDGLQLKWPNDILVADRKIAGILIETSCRASTMHAVIGVGVNCDLAAAPGEIDQPWTDLRRVLPKNMLPDRNQLALDIIADCLDTVERLPQERDAITAAYSSQMLSYATVLRVTPDTGKPVEGPVLGISRAGLLRIGIGNSERCFDSAGISVHRLDTAP